MIVEQFLAIVENVLRKNKEPEKPGTWTMNEVRDEVKDSWKDLNVKEETELYKAINAGLWVTGYWA